MAGLRFVLGEGLAGVPEQECKGEERERAVFFQVFEPHDGAP
jgi:hypothetical protein